MATADRLSQAVAEPLSASTESLQLSQVVAEPASQSADVLAVSQVVAEPLSQSAESLQLSQVVVEVIRPNLVAYPHVWLDAVARPLPQTAHVWISDPG